MKEHYQPEKDPAMLRGAGDQEAAQPSSREFSDSVDSDLQDGYTENDRKDMHRMGKEQQFRVHSQNRF